MGSEEESSLGTPVPDRAVGIDHDWGTGSIQNMSAIWRSRLYFNAGRYQFTTFSRDGVRLFIDEQLLIDQWIPDEFWYRFGTVIELAEGFHDIRAEWFATGQTPESTLLRLHWDRVPTAPEPHQVTPMIINVYLLKKQDICIVGNPWQSGERVAIYNPDGSEYRAWQREDAQELPRSLPASDPSLQNYVQVECFSFGYLPAEIPAILTEVEGFAGLIRNWSGGDIEPEIRLSQIEGEVNLARIGGSWWVPPWAMASFALPTMTTDTDFNIVLSSDSDLNTRRSYRSFGCGAAFGVDTYSMGGTGYSWISCEEDLVILHEWEHQFTAAVRHLLQFESMYTNEEGFPERAYPACSTGDADIFQWFPDSEDWARDPDSPWCGMYNSAEEVGIAEMHVFAHYDASLSHYPLGYFTGNHCSDQVQDFGESDVDTGADCPAKAPLPTVERQPSDDAWIQIGVSQNHGDDKQLRVRKDARVAFLKFDLQDIPRDVVNATLSIKAARTQAATVELYAVADTAWQEETLIEKNAPQLGERIDSAVISAKQEKTIRWDVTAYIREVIANGNKAVSFALVMADGKQLFFSSKEGKDSKEGPLLVLHWK